MQKKKQIKTVSESFLPSYLSHFTFIVKMQHIKKSIDKQPKRKKEKSLQLCKPFYKRGFSQNRSHSKLGKYFFW